MSFFRDLSSDISDVFGHLTIGDLIDVILVSFIIYQVIQLTRRTRASQVFKGLAIILVAAWLVDALKLQALGTIMNGIVGSGAVVLVVLFQPELRRVLEQIGRRTALDRTSPQSLDEGQNIVENIVDAMIRMSRRKVGALIVIEGRTGVHDVIQSGTAIDSLISSALLENIFEPNTPLHDGAVIIRDTRIVAAGCVLPLTEDNMLSRELGTRHRAGLGISETTDALSLIVSEETGTISLAKSGRLTRHLDGDALSRILYEIYGAPQRNALLFPGIFSFLNKRRGKP
jgi:diadenylate cyclase